MDVILFNPPRYSNGRHPKFNNALMWLASYLDQRGQDALVVPLSGPNYQDAVATVLAEHRPRVVAIACKWWDTLYASTHIASLTKRFDPTITTILGGQTATFFSTELVEQIDDVDWVIRGDGEEPLYRLVTGGEPVNAVTAGATAVAPIRERYVQSEDDLQTIQLSDDLAHLITDTSVLNSYIWTGKGCVETCVYCSANAWNNTRGFGRARYIFRPIDVILREIGILAQYPGSNRITLDFDPVRSPHVTDYYRELFARLPKKQHNCYFFSWSLPPKVLIDDLANTFNFVELCIDVQSCSERLRQLLGGQRILKPAFTDDALDDVLTHVSQYDHFIVDLSALMGLPFETDEDIAAIRTFSDYFYDKFEQVRYPYVSPMNVEPGSLLLRSPDRYEMVLFRKDFEDFLRYTRRSFEQNINCYQPSEYEPGVFHPLGACPITDYERGEVFRVYETWKSVQENIDRRSQEKAIARMRKYKQYGMLSAGILGGIDRPTSGRAYVE